MLSWTCLVWCRCTSGHRSVLCECVKDNKRVFSQTLLNINEYLCIALTFKTEYHGAHAKNGFTVYHPGGERSGHCWCPTLCPSHSPLSPPALWPTIPGILVASYYKHPPMSFAWGFSLTGFFTAMWGFTVQESQYTLGNNRVIHQGKWESLGQGPRLPVLQGTTLGWISEVPQSFLGGPEPKVPMQYLLTNVPIIGFSPCSVLFSSLLPNSLGSPPNKQPTPKSLSQDLLSGMPKLSMSTVIDNLEYMALNQKHRINVA